MKVGVIGVGKMGEALVAGLVRSRTVSPGEVVVSDVRAERVRQVAEAYGVVGARDNVDAVRLSEVVVIAVRPRDVQPVLEEVREALEPRHLLISIAAGVSTSYMARVLGKPIPVVRAMPNIAATVGEAVTALAPGPNASEEHLEVAERVFRAVGRTVRLSEGLLDVVTALSGGGPAYAFLFIEALTEAGARMGLPWDVARLLASQTVLGAARMVLETGEHPAKLREMVATPGGVTVEGLAELEARGVRAAIVEAVAKATRRAKDLLLS